MKNFDELPEEGRVVALLVRDGEREVITAGYLHKGNWILSAMPPLKSKREDVVLLGWDYRDERSVSMEWPKSEETKRIRRLISPVEMVDHPAHYNSGGIECIDAMLAAFGKEEVIAFCKLNAFKYVWRSGKKDGNSESQDLAKAAWYMGKAKELMGAHEGDS